MRKYLVLLLALFAINLSAQDIKLHVYEWKPNNFPITNILISWDGPCGTYSVLTNANIGDTNSWGIYDVIDRIPFINPTLYTVFNYANREELFFKVVHEDNAYTNCAEVPIWIVTHPYDQPAYTNWSVQFETYTIGPENRQHQWFFDGSPITGETNMVLKIDAVTPADEGEYYMVCYTASQSTTSQWAYLTVLEQTMPMPEPDPPEPPSMMSSLDLLLWSYDPLSIINPYTPELKKKLIKELTK